MNPLCLDEVRAYVNENIVDFVTVQAMTKWNADQTDSTASHGFSRAYP